MFYDASKFDGHHLCDGDYWKNVNLTEVDPSNNMFKDSATDNYFQLQDCGTEKILLTDYRMLAKRDRCDAFTSWMCVNDDNCDVPFPHGENYKDIFGKVRDLARTAGLVNESVTGKPREEAYTSHETKCAGLDPAVNGNSRRMTVNWGSNDECFDPPNGYNESRRIELSSVQSLFVNNRQINATFDLNVTSNKYRALVGVTTQDIYASPFNASNKSSWTLEDDECVQPLLQNGEGATASVVFNESCFYDHQTSHRTNASMYVIVYRCDSEAVVSRHVAGVTVDHFLRGTSEFVSFNVDGFVCEIEDFEIAVEKKIGKLRVGALDVVYDTVMKKDSLTIDGFSPFTDGRYRVVVGLNEDDCDSLEYERKTYQENETTTKFGEYGNHSVYLKVDNTSDWYAECDLPEKDVSELVGAEEVQGFNPDYFKNRTYCYCILTEKASDTWELFEEYKVNGTIVEGYEYMTWKPSWARRRLTTASPSLVGQTTTGSFAVRRAATSHHHHDCCEEGLACCDHHDHDDDVGTLWWMGLFSILGNTVVVILLLAICFFMAWRSSRRGQNASKTSKKSDSIAASINDEPWHERLRVPRFMPTTMVRRSVV